MSDDMGGRELAPRDHDGTDAGASSITPLPEGESRDADRFSAGPRAHSVGLTEERSAQIVRQSGNARNVVFLAILVITIFIPVYWFYEAGIPALGSEGRLAQEASRLAGGDLPDLPPVAQPGTPEAPRVIALTLTESLEIVGDDVLTTDALAVAAGETIRFELENTAGFPHNFVIGTKQDLEAGLTDGQPLWVPAWSSGMRSIEWVAPSSGRLQFACNVPGHYEPMHGNFVIQS
ncbi:MAG: hypothetical protein ACC726_09300 [Chloroflexota bacterium]